jgi:hypothetical protein
MQGLFDTTGSGPFQNMFQAMYGGLDNAALAFEPAMRGAARLQLEALGLVSRRAQAYMDLPQRLSLCRTPQDLVAEQTRFWQTAMQQYTDSSHRMLSAWSHMLTMPSPFAGATQPESRSRDIIRVPEPQAKAVAAATPRNKPTAAARRVA